MSDSPRIALFHGGVSSEREVSLGSGEAAAKSLEKNYAVDRFDITDDRALPAGVDPERHVVFSTLHGLFGEDGRMQLLLEAAGIEYAGSDAAASALTFDKVATKAALADAGVPVLPQLVHKASETLSAVDVMAVLGESVVIKPVAEGSSVGLGFARGEKEIQKALEDRPLGTWLLEPRVEGREGTVGMLDGQALGLVEIRPKSGVFDYSSKYTKGLTEYVAPADFDAIFTRRIRDLATRAYHACGCRDFARLDFMVDTSGEPYFLEINTLPGLKETSLLPMSAAVRGYNFDDLVQKLVAPAFLRYKKRYSVR